MSDQLNMMTTSERSVPARFFFPQLDGLRFVAFLGVFVHHTMPSSAEAWQNMLGSGALKGQLSIALGWFVGSGHMGVELFFVLSSFLITALLIREVEARGQLDVLRFWARRALRIWPVYFVVLLIAALTTWLGVPRQRLTLEAGAMFALFLGNWSVYWHGFPGSFASILWTVSIEEQFYIGWPLLVWWLGARRLLALSVALVLLAAGTRVLLIQQGGSLKELATHTVCRLDAIGLGAALGVLMHGPLKALRLPRLAGFALFFLGWLGLAVVARAVAPQTSAAHWALRVLPISPVSAALIVAAPLVSNAGYSVLASRFVSYLGRISYGLYAYHTFVLTLVVLLPFPRGAAGQLTRWAFAMLVTTLVASLSYRFLERPFLRLKDRFAVVRSGRS